MSSTRTSWALLYYHYEYYNTPASVGATFRLPCHVNPIELLGSWCWKSSPRERMYSLGPFLKSINSNPTTRFVHRVWRRNLPPTCFRHLMSRPGFSFFPSIFYFSEAFCNRAAFESGFFLIWFGGMKLLWRKGNLWLVIIAALCVIGSFSQCSCSVSLNLSDGHWEALFIFLKWRLTVVPKYYLCCSAALQSLFVNQSKTGMRPIHVFEGWYLHFW